jgi:hypothetical protein
MAALRFKLPANVTVTDEGCLWFGSSPPLYEALWDWLHLKFGKPFGEAGIGEYDYALPGDWWLRHSTSDNEAELCLDRLDAAAGAVRRRRDELHAIASYRPFHAEWVVDAEGAVQGDIAFCPRGYDGGGRYDPAAASALRQNVEKVLRAKGYGRGTRARWVALDWSTNGRLDTSVGPAARPIDRAKVEAQCDPRRRLVCTRLLANPQVAPAAADALRRCLDEAKVDTRTVSVAFDVSPDGVPEHVTAQPSVGAPSLPAHALHCLEAAFKEARYAPSDGGPCSANGGLESFISRNAPGG